MEQAAMIRDLVTAGRNVPLEAAPTLSEERGEAMIRDLRADRSRR